MTQDPRADNVRSMSRQDLDDVVGVHLRSFPEFFLSRLGPAFLRHLYRELIDDPTGIVLISKHNHSIQGFVAGSTESRGLYRRLLVRKWPLFAISSVAPAIRHPSLVPRLLNAFYKTDEETFEKGCGLLMSIAVDPQCQSKGIGTRLVHRFLAECRNRGLSSVRLTTDKTDNDPTNRFYIGLGFTVSKVNTTRQGRVMNEFRINVV